MRIVADKLGKRFNREWIFRNFSHQFEAGSRWVITGPNGAGKSTLMQVLWGQMLPSAGTLEHIGPRRAEDVYQHVAITAPYMDLIDEFTLDEAIAFHFRFKHSRFPLNEIPERLNLSAAREKPVGQFSSGMRQRLKLGLAFFATVDFLFFDEPCTNLDVKGIEWYHQQLADLPAQTSVIVASNNPVEYQGISSQIDLLSLK